MLNKALGEIYNMCEIESKEEFIEGVIETLGTSLQSFNKLKHKFHVEKLRYFLQN